MDKKDTLGSEAKFHDHWSAQTDQEEVLVEESFLTPSCPENLFILEKLGNLQGKTLLELGTGLGEGATFFAKRGAEVIATDISSGMLLLARRVGREHEVTFSTAVTDAAALPWADGSFDFVYAANLLHHVDIEACLQEVHRVLKPGGRAAFWDPVRYNPVINRYRKMADQVRTEDEHPLGIEDLRLMRHMFSSVQVRHLGLATLGVFIKFYFVDMVHPNEERYWKKFISDYSSFRDLYTVLGWMDRILLNIPGIRWLAWNIAVVMEK